MKILRLLGLLFILIFFHALADTWATQTREEMKRMVEDDD